MRGCVSIKALAEDMLLQILSKLSTLSLIFYGPLKFWSVLNQTHLNSLSYILLSHWQNINFNKNPTFVSIFLSCPRHKSRGNCLPSPHPTPTHPVPPPTPCCAKKETKKSEASQLDSSARLFVLELWLLWHYWPEMDLCGIQDNCSIIIHPSAVTLEQFLSIGIAFNPASFSLAITSKGMPSHGKYIYSWHVT